MFDEWRLGSGIAMTVGDDAATIGMRRRPTTYIVCVPTRRMTISIAMTELHLAFFLFSACFEIAVDSCSNLDFRKVQLI